MSTVYIDCPRCCGKGFGNWQPDAGICYLCRGKSELSVDLDRSARHLGYLRAEYVRRREVIKRALTQGEDVSYHYESLGYLVERGRQRRAIHEAALAVLH